MQWLYKAKLAVYHVLRVLVQDEVVKKREQETTLKEAKRREMLDQVRRTYFSWHVQMSSGGNATLSPYQLFLGEVALSVARNPPSTSLHIVAAMVLVRLSLSPALSLGTSTCVS